MKQLLKLLIFLFLFTFLYSQDKQHLDENILDEAYIGESVVSASILSENITQKGSNTSILNQKDINLRPNAKFSDTLRGLESINIPRGRGMETFDTITIRGIANGASILVDGVSLNDMNNNTKMLTSMTAMDLEQVEVVRGAFSSIYGSGAIGGVVNFITSMPQELEAKANLGYGNPFVKNGAPQNLIRGYVSVGDTFFDKTFRLKASYGFNVSKGYAADDAWVKNTVSGISGYKPSLSARGDEIYIVGNMGRQSFQNHDARLKSQIDINDSGMLDFGFNYSNYNYRHINQQTNLRDSDGNVYWGNDTSGSSGTIPYAFVGGMGNESYHQFIEYIKYRHLFEDSTLELNISRLDGSNTWLSPNNGASPFDGGGVNVDTKHQKTDLNLIYNIDFYNEVLGLLIGADYRLMQMDINESNINDWRYFNSPKISFKTKKGGKNQFGGIFLDLSARLLDKSLILSFGGRATYWWGGDYYNTNINGSANNNSKFAFSPKASIIYKPLEITALKFSFGQAFRVPTLNQMFVEYTRNDGISFIGNPNLKPETATSFDIGIEQDIVFEKYPLKGKLKAYYFYTDLLNLIYINTQGNNQYQNAGKARIQGLELSYNQSLPLGFGIRASYTYTNSKILKNNANLSSVGKRIEGISEHMGYVELNYENYGFFGSIGTEFQSKPFSLNNTISKVYGASDEYYLLDLKIGYNFTPNFALDFSATNILNYKYYRYYRASGAAFFINLSAKV